MTNVQIERFDLPALPAPKPGDEPVFIWDVYAQVRAGEIVSVVKRFAYWDEKDNRPLEVGFEAFVDGLPDSCGVADVVSADPDIFIELAAVSAKAAELLRECQ